MMRAVSAMLLLAAAIVAQAAAADARDRPRFRTSPLFVTTPSASCATGVIGRRAGRVRTTCSGRGLLYDPRSGPRSRRPAVRLRQVPRWAVAHSGEGALRNVMLRDCGWLAHDQCRARLDRSGRLQRVLGSAGDLDDADILAETGYPVIDDVPPIVLADPPARYRKSWQGFLPP